MPMNRHAEGAEAEEGYDAWTKEQLYELAQEWDLPGRSAMSREELMEALTAAEGGEGAGVTPAHRGDT